MRHGLLWIVVPLLLSACQRDQATVALGTLEWDRVELVSVAAEPITIMSVHEGEQVAAGASILEQRGDRAEAELAVATADLDRVREQLAEQQAGARTEQKREAAPCKPAASPWRCRPARCARVCPSAMTCAFRSFTAR